MIISTSSQEVFHEGTCYVLPPCSTSKGAGTLQRLCSSSHCIWVCVTTVIVTVGIVRRRWAFGQGSLNCISMHAQLMSSTNNPVLEDHQATQPTGEHHSPHNLGRSLEYLRMWYCRHFKAFLSRFQQCHARELPNKDMSMIHESMCAISMQGHGPRQASLSLCWNSDEMCLA